MGRACDGMLSPNPHHCEIRGRAAEIARALGRPVGGLTREVLNTALARLNRHPA